MKYTITAETVQRLIDNFSNNPAIEAELREYMEEHGIARFDPRVCPIVTTFEAFKDLRAALEMVGGSYTGEFFRFKHLLISLIELNHWTIYSATAYPHIKAATLCRHGDTVLAIDEDALEVYYRCPHAIDTIATTYVIEKVLEAIDDLITDWSTSDNLPVIIR